MRYFDTGNRVTQDDCAQEAKLNENTSIMNYRLYNPYGVEACEKKIEKLNALVADNPNLRFRDGYGVAQPCLIDQDSRLRNETVSTNVREKQQLSVRFFHAVPDVSHGAFIPNTESLLKIGAVDSTHERQCDRLAEKDFDRFTPFVPCMTQLVRGEAEATPGWTEQFGASSRETVRQKEFLESCGYTFDGKAWRQAATA
jgi:hypothetical protein